MKITTKAEAMRIARATPSRIMKFCTGKYRWEGSASAYVGRDIENSFANDVLAIWIERRQDSDGPYAQMMCAVPN